MALEKSASREIQSLATELSANGFAEDHGTIIYPSSPEYADETRVWGAQRDLKPQMVLRPETLEDVQLVTRLLFNSKLDFVVRNGSVGSASSKDVVLSLANFRDVQFDAVTETTQVGAGAIWTHVDEHMAAHATGWAGMRPSFTIDVGRFDQSREIADHLCRTIVVAARTPFVGVVGMTLIGGLSWLSHEYGLVSDPANLLDVQMVLGDGRIIWTSEEPELLWAVRGGRCAFGVITRLKLRARRYKTEGIHFGQIRYPLDRLREVSRGIAKHVASNHDPKVAFHACVLNPKSPFLDASPGVAIVPFDARGTEHAKTLEGFKWATDIEGATEDTREMTLCEVNRETDYAKTSMGKSSSYDATGLLPEIDDELLVRANNWFQRVVDADDAFAVGSYCLIELIQEAAFCSTKDPNITAWPRPGHRHVLQLGVGYPPEHAHLKESALRLLKAGFEQIPQSPLGKGDFKPTFFEPTIMDARKMYGSNYDRLERIADRWDPKRRFRTLFKPNPNFI